MPIMILGLVFLVGLFVFYLVSTSGGSKEDNTKTEKKESDLKTDGNVVYLPKDLENEKKKHRKK